MERFAIALSRHGEFGRPVVDHTGLTGEYDFAVSAVSGASATMPMQFITGVQEQLGLTLRGEESAVDVLNIRRIERPSPN